MCAPKFFFTHAAGKSGCFKQDSSHDEFAGIFVLLFFVIP